MRVLYIDLDTCRADHLGANGYHRNTSPTIDRIAEEGVTFTHCYAANTPCLPSRASLLTGRFGINNGVVTNDSVADHGKHQDLRPFWYGHRMDPEKPFLQHHLWSQGMKTVSFSPFHDRHNAWWFAAGWEELHTFTHNKGDRETAHKLNKAFLPWLRIHGQEDNWFVHLNYWDIHAPYEITKEWADRFADDPPPPWPDQAAIGYHQSIYGPHTAVDHQSQGEMMPEAIHTTDDFKKLIDGYDGAIAYTDHHIGQVVDTLEKLGLLDETAVIVSGDHGDSFGEHGQYAEHGIANEAVHNIPMIIRWPGLTRQGSCDKLIYGLDLGPTLCDLLGFPTPAGWDGRSFAPALCAEEFAGWPYLVWDHGIYTFTRAVRTPDWLLIHILHPGCYPYDEPYWLHDMVNDPYQTEDVSAQHPEVVARLDKYLTDWRHEQIRKGAAPDPLEQKVREGPFLYMTPEQMIEILESTGRSHFAEDLKRRLSKFHPGRFEV